MDSGSAAQHRRRLLAEVVRSIHCMPAVGMWWESCRSCSSTAAEGQLRIWARSRRSHQTSRLALHCWQVDTLVSGEVPRTVAVVREERGEVRKWTRNLVVVDRT